MKVVLAEKVSASTVAVFADAADWNVVTHDQIKNGLPAELSDADALIVRSAVQVDAALLEHAPKLRVIGRAWRGRGQYRRGRCHAQRHRGDEHAGRECRGRRRIDAGADDFPGPHGAARQRHHA